MGGWRKPVDKCEASETGKRESYFSVSRGASSCSEVRIQGEVNEALQLLNWDVSLSPPAPGGDAGTVTAQVHLVFQDCSPLSASRFLLSTPGGFYRDDALTQQLLVS